MRGVQLASSIAAVFTAFALGAAAGQAQEQEEVKIVFERAIPNIPGKSLIAQVVTYAPGGQVTVPSPCPIGVHLRTCTGRRHSQPG
jgi:hypothetical protein